MTWQQTKGRQLPANWSQLRLQVFERDHWTCQTCGHHDPTGHTLECDHTGHRDDHRTQVLRTLCGRGSQNNCHGKRTAQQAAEARAQRPRTRRPSEPHPGLT